MGVPQGPASVAPLVGATTNAARDVIRALKQWRPAPQTRAFLDHLHDVTFSQAGFHRQWGHEQPGSWASFDLSAWCSELRMPKTQVCQIRKRLVDARVIWYDAARERIGWNLDLGQWATLAPDRARWGGARSGAGRKKGNQAGIANLNLDPNQDGNTALSRWKREEAPAPEIVGAGAVPLRMEKEETHPSIQKTSPYGDVVRANRTDDTTARARRNVRQAPQAFPEDGDAYQLAAYLRDAILAHKPDARVPRTAKDVQRWARATDALLRIDKRDVATTRRVIDWATRDPFWQANILSPGKLREKFDTLHMQSEKGRGTSYGRSTPAGPTAPDPYNSGGTGLNHGRYADVFKRGRPSGPPKPLPSERMASGPKPPNPHDHGQYADIIKRRTTRPQSPPESIRRAGAGA